MDNFTGERKQSSAEDLYIQIELPQAINALQKFANPAAPRNESAARDPVNDACFQRFCQNVTDCIRKPQKKSQILKNEE